MNEILSQEKSIYIQIKEMIENDILRDILLEEERVPSTNELAKAYSINPATAAKGVNLLVDEGILYKKRGIGMFVQTGAKKKIMEKRKKNFYDDYVKRLMAEAASLGITKEELIAMIKGNSAENADEAKKTMKTVRLA
ncbi:MAG: GntR family transcriptional regulator [Clostridiales bacterium]|nr:GntR family transcriptional regulator [Clostridiales bacterium]